MKKNFSFGTLCSGSSVIAGKLCRTDGFKLSGHLEGLQVEILFS